MRLERTGRFVRPGGAYPGAATRRSEGRPHARRLGLALALAWCLVVGAPVAGAAPTPIFHPLEGRVGRCLACHEGAALGAPAVPVDHREFDSSVCLTCHARPGGSAAALYGLFVPTLAALVFGLYRVAEPFGIRDLLAHLGRRGGER